MSDGFVYAIECGDAVKIGFTTNIARRMSQLSAGSSDPLRLIGFAAGTVEHEREIQALCAASHPPVRGELPSWRDLGPSFLAQELRDRGVSITSQAVSQWSRVPRRRARLVSEITGIPLHQLRPDIWLSA